MKIYCSGRNDYMIDKLVGGDAWVHYDGYIHGRGSLEGYAKVLYDKIEGSTGRKYYGILWMPILALQGDTYSALTEEQWRLASERIFGRVTVTLLHESCICEPLELFSTDEIIEMFCDVVPFMNPGELKDMVERASAE